MDNNLVLSVGTIVILVLSIVAGWKVLDKAGDHGWKILIPIYGTYCIYKAADSEGVFWGTVFTTVVTYFLTYVFADTNFNIGIIILTVIELIILIVFRVKYVKRMAEVFGKTTGFAVGLFFLEPIFLIILGFGSARHYRN